MRLIEFPNATSSRATEPSFENLRVVIAEDDWLIGMALQDMLTEIGCTVVGAASEKRAALALVQEQDFDVAVLDYWLRDDVIDDVAHALQSRNVPFAVATGFGVKDISPRLRHAPILTKPYILQDVADVLAQLVAARPTGLSAATCGAVQANG